VVDICSINLVAEYTHLEFFVCRLLSGLVDFDGFYLESDPCLVCNNPEVPYNNSKLSAIKADARFSTTSHMVKLVGSHNISKITLRVTDVKRQKMVRSSFLTRDL
jgi:E3 ubiquitin-protein ligase UBR4